MYRKVLFFLILLIAASIFLYLHNYNENKPSIEDKPTIMTIGLIFCDVSTSIKFGLADSSTYNQMKNITMQKLRELYDSQSRAIFYLIHEHTKIYGRKMDKYFSQPDANKYHYAKDSLITIFDKVVLNELDPSIRLKSCISSATFHLGEIIDEINLKYSIDNYKFIVYFISDMLEDCNEGFFSGINFHDLEPNPTDPSISRITRAKILNRANNNNSNYDFSKMDVTIKISRINNPSYSVDPEFLKQVWRKYFVLCGIDSTRFHWDTL